MGLTPRSEGRGGRSGVVEDRSGGSRGHNDPQCLGFYTVTQFVLRWRGDRGGPVECQGVDGSQKTPPVPTPGRGVVRGPRVKGLLERGVNDGEWGVVVQKIKKLNFL